MRFPWRRPPGPGEDLRARIADLTGVRPAKRRGPAEPLVLARILAATDGTSAGATAVEWAAWLSSRLDAECSVLSVLAPQADEREARSDSTLVFETGLSTRSGLDDATALAERHGVTPIRVEVRTGNVVPEIAKACGDWRTDLLVVGSGRPRREFRGLGGTAEQLLQTVPCSVLVARRFAPPTRILAPVDGSAASVDAAQVAYALASRFGVPLSVVHAQAPSPVRRPELPEEPRWDHPGPPVTFRAEGGSAVPLILERARLDRASWIVLGGKGMTAAPGWSLGGVSSEVARAAEQTVLLVKRSGR